MKNEKITCPYCQQGEMVNKGSYRICDKCGKKFYNEKVIAPKRKWDTNSN
jgi:transposase-like protein